MGDGFANGVIRLENEPRPVFYSGQEISGSVLFELQQPLKFSVLTLTFLGEANVLWTEDQKEEYNGVVRHRLVKYIGYEEYVKSTEFLAGGQGISMLPAGSRAYPFKFRIPFTAPSSFTGEKGSVSYCITACLVSADPMKMNEELFKEFQVIAPLDLNIEPPDVKRPIQMEFEEVYGCDCICSPQPMTVKVYLPVTGYCPGQVVPVSVYIENDSTTEINKIVFQLLSKERYRSKQPIAEYMLPEKVLTTYKSGAILGKSKRNFTCDLMIPEMIAPNLEHCSIIDVRYFFRIKIKLSGCNSDLKDESEIYLGLIPIAETTEGDYVHPLVDQLPILPIPDPSKQYDPPEAVNPAFVGPTNTPYSPANNNSDKNSPYPHQNTPYPTQNTPYPLQNSPYPSQNSPYPVAAENTSYPSKTSPYPTEVKADSSITEAKPNYKNSPYPPENTPYPTQNTPYPPQNTPYPLQNSPYPSQNTPYPSQNSPYPVAAENTSYPSKPSPYPTEVKADSSITEAKPNPLGYQIGFRATESESVVSPPYPLVNNMPGTSPPYPVTNMPGLPFPTGERNLRIDLPPLSPRVEPSAPPPST